jgi:hypothetical protein
MKRRRQILRLFNIDGGMILTGEYEAYGEKPAPISLCPKQILPVLQFH